MKRVPKKVKTIADVVSAADLDSTFEFYTSAFLKDKSLTEESEMEFSDRFNFIMDDPDLSRSFVCLLIGHIAEHDHGIPDNFENN